LAQLWDVSVVRRLAVRLPVSAPHAQAAPSPRPGARLRCSSASARDGRVSMDSKLATSSSSWSRLRALSRRSCLSPSSPA
jgi:hypothetical protein